MARRKRRKITKRPKRTLSKVFLCPKCGKRSIRVKVLKEKRSADIQCGSCKLSESVRAHILTDPIDAYHEFLDNYSKTH